MAAMDEYATPYDLAAQQRANEEARLAKDAIKDQRRDDWLWLMDSARGRRIVRQIVAECQMDAGFTNDPMTLAAWAGRRQLGLLITEWAQESKPLYAIYLTEAL